VCCSKADVQPALGNVVGADPRRQDEHLSTVSVVDVSKEDCASGTWHRMHAHSGESVVVVIVVDLYSASRSAPNALDVLLLRHKMSFQRRSEAVGTPSRVPE